jgi:ABC-type uncharacterized transport system permease subunit
VVKKALAALLSASLALSTPWAQAQVRLPALGDSASEDLPVGAERRLGEQIMREIKRDPAYLDDPVLLDYVRSLWGPLLQAARSRGDIGPEIEQAFAWNLFLVQDRSVNAFALPGGHVGVHLGLIAVTATRDELAAVLAHELSHVSQRHIARSMGSASRQGALGVAAMLLGVLIAARSSNPDAAQAAIAGGQAAMIQGQLNFSRDMEREADRIGYGVFRDAGFAAPGMAAMFDKLDQAGRLNDSGGFPYLRSHPLTSERLAEARSRLSDQAMRAGVGSDTLHELMQARARALMDPTVDNWRRLVAQAQQAPVAASAGAAPSPSGTAAGRAGALQAGTPYAGTLYVGTLYAGALAVAALGSGAIDAPSVVLIPLLMFAAALAGAAMLLGPALLKRYMNVDDVVTTLLLNFIMALFVSIMIQGPMRDPLAMGWPQTMNVLDAATLDKLIAQSRLHTGLLLGLALCALMALVESRSVFGLQRRAVGLNPHAAHFAGIPATRVLLWTAVGSGGLAGLAGAVEVMGLRGYVAGDLSPGYGYAGVIVAMLAQLHPLGVPAAAMLVASVFVGADAMSRAFNVPSFIADVMVSLSLLSMMGASFFLSYRVRR